MSVSPSGPQRAAALYVFRDDEARLERYPSMYIVRQRSGSGGGAGQDSTQDNSSEPSGPTTDVGEVAVETAEQPDEEVQVLAQDA